MPAGIISQTARGPFSLATSSCGLAAGTILPPLFSIACLMSLTTSAVIVATVDSMATVLSDYVRVGVGDDDLVAGLGEPPHHVLPHAAQTDHSQLHGGCSLV